MNSHTYTDCTLGVLSCICMYIRLSGKFALTQKSFMLVFGSAARGLINHMFFESEKLTGCKVSQRSWCSLVVIFMRSLVYCILIMHLVGFNKELHNIDDLGWQFNLVVLRFKLNHTVLWLWFRYVIWDTLKMINK